VVGSPTGQTLNGSVRVESWRYDLVKVVSGMQAASAKDRSTVLDAPTKGQVNYSGRSVSTKEESLHGAKQVNRRRIVDTF
jgi:hypothetical protein